MPGCAHFSHCNIFPSYACVCYSNFFFVSISSIQIPQNVDPTSNIEVAWNWITLGISMSWYAKQGRQEPWVCSEIWWLLHWGVAFLCCVCLLRLSWCCDSEQLLLWYCGFGMRHNQPNSFAYFYNSRSNLRREIRLKETIIIIIIITMFSFLPSCQPFVYK